MLCVFHSHCLHSLFSAAFLQIKYNVFQSRQCLFSECTRWEKKREKEPSRNQCVSASQNCLVECSNTLFFTWQESSATRHFLALVAGLARGAQVLWRVGVAMAEGTNGLAAYTRRRTFLIVCTGNKVHAAAQSSASREKKKAGGGALLPPFPDVLFRCM